MDCVAKKEDVPHIKVSVEFRGEKVEQECAFFIDSIEFLCQCEAAIRRGKRLRVESDVDTERITRDNLQRLIGVKL